MAEFGKIPPAVTLCRAARLSRHADYITNTFKFCKIKTEFLLCLYIKPPSPYTALFKKNTKKCISFIKLSRMLLVLFIPMVANLLAVGETSATNVC